MTTFVLPLQNVPQVFDIALAGVNYTMTCRWNAAPDAGWVLDLVNADSGVPVVANVPLITGADCLAGLEYLGINGQMIVLTDGDAFAVPTLENLGVESNLYFLTDVASA
jgi:hypothetical protein